MAASASLSLCRLTVELLPQSLLAAVQGTFLDLVLLHAHRTTGPPLLDTVSLVRFLCHLPCIIVPAVPPCRDSLLKAGGSCTQLSPCSHSPRTPLTPPGVQYCRTAEGTQIPDSGLFSSAVCSEPADTGEPRSSLSLKLEPHVSSLPVCPDCPLCAGPLSEGQPR